MKKAIRMTMAAAALGVACGAASAQQSDRHAAATDAGAARAALREQAFWLCDYIATSRGTQFAPVECVQVTDELKHARFGGDYDRMVGWWRERKPFEHRRLRLAEELQ